MAAGAYIPSCLVHAWHNNNNVHENSRAANTGFFVGLGNLAGILSAATFRTEYAPGWVAEVLWEKDNCLTICRYIPTLVATCCCNGVCIIFVAGIGLWMRMENRRRDREQGSRLQEGQVDTSQFKEGNSSPDWRYFLWKHQAIHTRIILYRPVAQWYFEYAMAWVVRNERHKGHFTTSCRRDNSMLHLLTKGIFLYKNNLPTAYHVIWRWHTIGQIPPNMME